MENKEYLKASVNILWCKLSTYKEYESLLKGLKSFLDELEEKLIVTGYPKGISFSNDPKVSSHKPIDERYNEVLTDIDFTEKRIDHVTAILQSIVTIKELCSSEIQEYIQYKFFEGHTWEETERKFFKTQKALDYQIKKELLNIISRESFYKEVFCE